MSICGPNCQWPVCPCPKPGARYQGPIWLSTSQRADLERAARYLASNNDDDSSIEAAEADRIAAVLRALAADGVSWCNRTECLGLVRHPAHGAKHAQ